MRIRTLELRQTPSDIAAAFGWKRCVFLERLHLVDEEPIAMGRSFLPAALATLSRLDAEKRPTYAILAELAGLDVERAYVTLGATTADQELEEALKVQKGSALILMERTSYFADDTPAEKSVFYIRPERYRFTVSSYFKR
jgi:GntR family transcriptional regulator